jgi:hypothetical protein
MIGHHSAGRGLGQRRLAWRSPYDIEAGMRYLFIDTPRIRTPQGVGKAEKPRMVLVMGVSGQWRPAR